MLDSVDLCVCRNEGGREKLAEIIHVTDNLIDYKCRKLMGEQKDRKIFVDRRFKDSKTSFLSRVKTQDIIKQF